MQKTANMNDSVEIATGAGAFITEAKVQAPTTTHTTMVPTKRSAESDEEGDNRREVARVAMTEKRDIVDMILVWEDTMNQLIYADK